MKLPLPRTRTLSAGHDERTQQRGDAPGLRDAAARCERWDRVEHLADRADTRFAEVRDEAFELRASLGDVIRLQPHPRVDVGTDQPAPHGALVIRRIARAKVAVVAGLELWIAGCERALADRRDEQLHDDVPHRRPARGIA